MANNNDKFISRENAKTLWGYMIDLLTGKQNKLTFDDTPTQGSDNPVKSGGIFTALAGKGTYSKPSGGIPKTDLASTVQTSLGKADSALQSETDPTVPSWAKATNKPSYTQDEVGDGTTYKRVTQTEKNTWNGKQNALTTIQMNAVNSGITSAGVTQISTNQTNILYNLNMGAKNVASIDNAVFTAGSTNRFLEIPCGGNLSGWIHIHLDSITSDDTNASTCAYLLVYTNGQTSMSAQINRGVVFDKNVNIESFKLKSIYIYPSDNYTDSEGDTFTLTNFAITSKAIWDQYPTFTPASLPNHDLTVLEAEDRAALAEVVDGGAKNLLKYDLASLKALNTEGTWNDNQYTINGVTFTVNSDLSIKANGTSNSSNHSRLRLMSFTAQSGLYISGCPSDSAANTGFFIYFWGGNTYAYSDGCEFDSDDIGNTSYITVAVIQNKTASNKVFYPMICTLADWKMSQKFVPYCRIPKVIADLYKEIAGSTTLTNTGLEYYLESGAKYRITAFAEYGASNPLEIVICKSNGVVLGQSSISPASGTTIGYVVAIGYLDARSSATITLKARFSSATSNFVGMIIEKI